MQYCNVINVYTFLSFAIFSFIYLLSMIKLNKEKKSYVSVVLWKKKSMAENNNNFDDDDWPEHEAAREIRWSNIKQAQGGRWSLHYTKVQGGYNIMFMLKWLLLLVIIIIFNILNLMLLLFVLAYDIITNHSG